MAMVRSTHWWTRDQLDQVAVAARARRVSASHYIRHAVSAQLGRDGARDEVADLRDLVDTLRAELDEVRTEVTALRRRVSAPR